MYGPHNILAVHVVTFSPKLVQLMQQYTATRTQLVDLICHYTRLLDNAAAAAAASSKGTKKMGWKGRQQHIGAIRPIKIQLVSHGHESWTGFWAGGLLMAYVTIS